MSQPQIIRWDQAYNRSGDAKLPRAVVNVIRTYMDNDTLTGWVKAETLAKATGLQIRGVRKQIAANVAAGWLEIPESGNSSGKANTYRLTYPKGVPQDTVSSEAPQQRVSHRTPLESEGCPTGPGKGVPQDTPTSNRTSPQEKLLTTPKKGVLEDTIEDERLEVALTSPTESTSQSKGVLQDTVPSHWEATAQRGAPISDPYDDPWIRTPVPVSVYAPAPEDDPWARSWPVDTSTAR